MRNHILFLASFILLLASCKDPKANLAPDGSDAQVEATAISELDSIRSLSMQGFTDAMAEDDTPDQVPSQKKGILCTPCDIDFLVYISKKSDYNMQDVKTLLCLDDKDQCEDNVEFTEFYNEMIFKVFQREKNDFTDAELKTLLNDPELIEELSQPVQDGNTTELLKELKADAENPKD